MWANWDVEELVAIGCQLHEGFGISNEVASVEVEGWPLNCEQCGREDQLIHTLH